MGLYENQRATTGDKRVLNLTRSSFAGQQRYATVVWNGDGYAFEQGDYSITRCEWNDKKQRMKTKADKNGKNYMREIHINIIK